MALMEEQSAQRIVFEQPIFSGIAGNIHVPLAEGPKYPTDKSFNLILWQPNPYRSDGLLVPTRWTAGDMTGFYPIEPLAEHQMGFQDAPGTSTAQMEGGFVGAYLNSKDVRADSRGESKMMITPAYRPLKDQVVHPFAQNGTAVINSLELQVPTARDDNKPGNYTYVVADMLFEDVNTHTTISYGATLFHHTLSKGVPPTPELLRKMEVGVFDVESNSFQVSNPLEKYSRVVTALPGSALFQTQPWRGWQRFEFAITRNDFITALRSLRARAPAFKGSENPEDYALMGWHLNAELQFGSGPAELGWSMRGAELKLAPEGDLPPR
jgi:hypothetical protein